MSRKLTRVLIIWSANICIKNKNNTLTTLHSSSIFAILDLFLLLKNVLFEFQSNWPGSCHDSVPSRRVVISHNMDKALKEGESYLAQRSIRSCVSLVSYQTMAAEYARILECDHGFLFLYENINK